ncbi:MAG: cytochrome c biogenesis protein CcsA [Phycisphaerales bacterium]|nr:cytochrome c biogenesis protein CcsA [Phycisphaerales bacterium]
MKSSQRVIPWIVFVLAMIYASQKVFMPERIDGPYDLNTFREIAVSAKGRTKPIDTVARNGLMNISGRQSIQGEYGEEDLTAIEWYIELATVPTQGLDRKVFRIDHPDVLTLAGLDGEDRTRFSYNEIKDAEQEINRQAELASNTKAKARDPFQRAVLVLAQRLSLYRELSSLGSPYYLPPNEVESEWRSFIEVINMNPQDQDAQRVLQLLKSYRDAQRMEEAVASGEATQEDLDEAIGYFNSMVAAQHEVIKARLPGEVIKSKLEVIKNQARPFVSASALYVMAFLAGCFGLMTTQLKKDTLSKTLLGTMTSLVVAAFIVQTIGIIARIYLQGRPPVTNLYSSAIFVGWFCAIIGLYIDRHMKLGLGGIMASVIGFGTLIVAHNLGSSGDTMEMMQAVLDSNFWLATHVVVITIGYSATFFAGFLSIAYLLLGIFTSALDRERGKSLVKMIYGVICFATVLSFVGTVLGGIWADQSWGRFWGWDAKENGAALIVFMNLLILHARWGGMIRDRGIVNLAIAGNIITAWSWFGTNMLGVGLHSYGFTQSAMFWLIMFVLSQLSLISLGLLPMKYWRSKFERPEVAAESE